MDKLVILVFIFLNSTSIKGNDMIDSLTTYLKNKDWDKTIQLITKYPEVLDQKDGNGSSGLFIIAYSGFDNVFNKAKELKKYFNFHEAIVCGKIEVVKKMIDQDINLANEYSADGFVPLSLAAFFSQIEIAQILLENGANPNLQATNPSKVNALHSAVAKENFELCELLIKNGINVNATQIQNVTALHSATHRGNLKIVRLLVENGANINLKMENGDSAIDIARRENRKEVLEYLEKVSK